MTPAEIRTEIKKILDKFTEEQAHDALLLIELAFAYLKCIKKSP